jgi:hypothetical protein
MVNYGAANGLGAFPVLLGESFFHARQSEFFAFTFPFDDSTGR